MPCERQYATTGDYGHWTGKPPPRDLDRRVLVRASRRIDTALIGAVYDVDDGGMPTHPDVRATLREAVCAQVKWQRDNGDPDGTGVAPQWTDVSVGDVRLSRKTSPPSGPGEVDLAPDAEQLLRQEGLLPINPWVRG